jgi:hypothetical protein
MGGTVPECYRVDASLFGDRLGQDGDRALEPPGFDPERPGLSDDMPEMRDLPNVKADLELT